MYVFYFIIFLSLCILLPSNNDLEQFLLGKFFGYFPQSDSGLFNIYLLNTNAQLDIKLWEIFRSLKNNSCH